MYLIMNVIIANFFNHPIYPFQLSSEYVVKQELKLKYA